MDIDTETLTRTLRVELAKGIFRQGNPEMVFDISQCMSSAQTDDVVAKENGAMKRARFGKSLVPNAASPIVD